MILSKPEEGLMDISQHDRDILRALGEEVAEIAETDDLYLPDPLG